MTPEQFRLLTGGMAHLSGWSVVPVIAELMLEGPRIDSPHELVSILCNALREAGANLLRVRISLNVLHPEVIGRTYTWWRAQGVVEEESALHSVRDTDAYIGSPMQHLHLHRQPVRYRLQEESAEALHSSLRELQELGCTDYAGFPMVCAQGRVQSLIFATDDPKGFNDIDLTKLSLVSAVMVPYFEVVARQQLCDSLLSTYIGPRIAERVMSGQIKRGDMEEIHAALWFSDLREFTHLSEHQPADKLLEALNSYFEAVAAEVTSRGGEILRFIGDAMLIVFPVSGQVTLEMAAGQALMAAKATLARMDAINIERAAVALPELRFGLGLHVGQVQYGNVGAPSRLDFTVMGPAVNRTARIEDFTKTLERPVLLSAAMARLVECPLEDMGTHAMRGIDEPIQLFAPRLAPAAVTTGSENSTDAR